MVPFRFAMAWMTFSGRRLVFMSAGSSFGRDQSTRVPADALKVNRVRHRQLKYRCPGSMRSCNIVKVSYT